MSQPALSHQIRRLEALVGVPLLTRTTRSVQLTPAGAVMYAHAQPLCNDMERMIERVRLAARGEGGRIAIGLTPTGACSPLAGALHRYRLAHPNVEIDLLELNSVRMQGALRLREIDVALMRPSAVDADIAVQEVYREPMFVGMRREHPLAARSLVDMHDLADEPLIGYRSDSSPYFRALVHDAFSKANVVPTFVQESVLPTILTLVEAGVGAAVVPFSAVNERGGALAFRPLPRRPELTATIVVTTLESPDNAAVGSLVEALCREYASTCSLTKKG